MTLAHAATSGNMPAMPVVPLILFVLILTVGYAGACYLRPFARCPRCKGERAVKGTLGDRLLRGQPTRRCPRCSGTGLRLRIGRRFYNNMSARQRQSQR